jgi:hypothetical protein
VRRLLCLTAFATALLGAATPANARTPLEIAVQDDGAFLGLPGNGPTLHNVKAAYRAAHLMHARVQKVNLLWKWVARRSHGQETFDWSFYDGAIVRAIGRGYVPQVTLTGPAPRWATGNHEEGVYKPDPAAFGRFVAAAAQHYAGRVRRWAIWNEPNWPSWLAPPRKAAGIYRRLYRAGWNALKAADPQSLVLIGELAPMGPPEAAIPPLRFLRGVTCRDRDFEATHECTPLVSDGFAHHPYTLRWPPEYKGPGRDDVTMGSLGRLRFALRELARTHALATPAGRPLPVYLTEYGYHANSHTIRERDRSRYAVRAFRMAAAAPGVRQLLWYQLVGTKNTGHRRWDTGVLGPNGRPRPILAKLTRWLDRAAKHDMIAAR